MFSKNKRKLLSYSFIQKTDQAGIADDGEYEYWYTASKNPEKNYHEERSFELSYVYNQRGGRDYQPWDLSSSVFYTLEDLGDLFK